MTPLQLAVAYATLANGGDVVRPHLAQQVEDPTGRVVEEINPESRRHVDIDPVTQQTILDGLHGAAMEEGGTSYGDLRRLADRYRRQDRYRRALRRCG